MRWTFSWAHLASQARSRQVEPACARQVSAAKRTILETLTGGTGTATGNHRCRSLMRETCPAAPATSLRPPRGVPCGGSHPPLPEPRAAARSATAGPAGVRPHCCEPGGWRTPRGGPGDLLGRNTGSAPDEGRLPELVKAAACTHAELRTLGVHIFMR